MTLRQALPALFLLASLMGLGACKSVCEKGLEMAVACTETWCESNPDATVCADLDRAKANAEAAFSECTEQVKALSERLTGEDGCIPWHDYLDAANAVATD